MYILTLFRSQMDYFMPRVQGGAHVSCVCGAPIMLRVAIYVPRASVQVFRRTNYSKERNHRGLG